MYYLAQASTSLYRMTTAGVATALTLPTGVVIESTKRPRFAVLNRQLVIVNSPSENLWMDPFGVVRPLSIKPPAGAPTLAGTGSGSLTGSYRAKMTFYIRDPITRAIISESDFGPISQASASLASQNLLATTLSKSQETIDGRRLYRTVTGPGTSYFRWVDLEGNSGSQLVDGMTDAALGLTAAPTDLGAAPGRFEIIVEWKDRLWAKALNALDNAYYSANRKHYAWPATNYLAIRPLGNDAVGITTFAPRRDELGIGKKNVFWKVIGDPPDIRLIKVYEGKGPVSHDATVIINDVAYMLFRDGVYTWGPDGIKCITDEAVKPWFTTDTYFNRSRFDQAFARYNEKIHAYELCLAAAGSSNEDRWVSFHIQEQKWLGPHKMTGFTPTCTAVLEDSNGVRFPVIGTSDGFLLAMNQSTRADAGNAIDFDVKLRHFQEPDLEKYWGQMSIHTRQESGGTLTITPAVGELDATDQASAISHDLTLERELLRRLSTDAQQLGRVCTLTFRENTLNQALSIFGYEIPYSVTGRRGR